jgi:uncharacterized membrane protein YjgN (DUF898 family)
MVDDPVIQTTSPEAPTPAEFRIRYDGRTGHVAAIAITNLLLAIPTLGFYRFWGKTRLRRYVWSHIEFHGERVEYAGRGMELFVGFLVALAVLIPYGVIVAIAEEQFQSVEGQIVLGVVNLLVLFFLIQMARYRARRYRLNRTRWRGIRGAQTGAAWQYALKVMAYTVLLGVTLGLSLPLGRTRLQAFRTNNTWFGTECLQFDARAGSLMRTWVLCWVLFIPSFGISYLWYRAAEFRIFAAHTRVAGLSFASNLKGGSLLGVLALYISTFVLVIILAAIPLVWLDLVTTLVGLETAGLETPAEGIEAVYLISFGIAFMGILILGTLHLLINLQRLFPLLLDRLTITGTADFVSIAQSQQEMAARGEGLADAFDVGEF